jgi:hypothetical protein
LELNPNSLKKLSTGAWISTRLFIFLSHHSRQKFAKKLEPATLKNNEFAFSRMNPFKNLFGRKQPDPPPAPPAPAKPAAGPPKKEPRTRQKTRT